MVRINVQANVSLVASVCLQDDGQDFSYRFIELLRRKCAALGSLDDLVGVLATAARHFEIGPGFQTSHAVIDAAPVGHDKARKAPLLAQDIPQ